MATLATSHVNTSHCTYQICHSKIKLVSSLYCTLIGVLAINLSSDLVPNQELSVIFNPQDWLYHCDDEELEDEALFEQGLEFGVGVRDAEVRVGAVE